MMPSGILQGFEKVAKLIDTLNQKQSAVESNVTSLTERIVALEKADKTAKFTPASAVTTEDLHAQTDAISQKLSALFHRLESSDSKVSNIIRSVADLTESVASLKLVQKSSSVADSFDMCKAGDVSPPKAKPRSKPKSKPSSEQLVLALDTEPTPEPAVVV
jgi:type I site-specific restriction endonuclease